MQLLHMAVNCNQGSKLHNHILYASPTAGILHHYRNFLTPFVERNKNTVLSTCKTISFSLFLLTSFGRENFKQSLQPLYIPINCPSFYCFILQGSYRLWKTWKVMEFSNLIFQAWKVKEFNCRLVLESRGKLKFCLIHQLRQMTRQGQCKIGVI